MGARVLSGLAGVLLGAGIVLAAGASEAAPATSCADLATLKLSGGEVTSAAVVGPAEFEAAHVTGVAAPVCRVKITARPTADSDIKIELWIPEGAAFNGNYLQVGNGGFAGSIPVRGLVLGVKAGYATAGTDDGHEIPPGADATWAGFAVGHPEKVRDFGYRAIKATTDLSKAVLAAYRGAPRHAYFNGCSDGGREALMEVQRYPEDFDGVVAGDPANNWTELQAGGLLLLQKVGGRPAALLPPAKLPALQAAALAQCGDPLGVVNDPLTCRFNPKVVLCRGTESDACLTPTELGVAEAIYAGAKDPSGRTVLPGFEPGAEAARGGWAAWILGDPAKNERSIGASFTRSFFADVVEGRDDYDVLTFDYAKDMGAVRARLGPILDAVSPDLAKFKARGGKLIQYHGWADPAIPPKTSIAYFEAVQNKMGNTADFYRLFMVPGMLHCQGGPGPSVFDMQAAISRWVEAGTAPDTVAAVKPAPPGSAAPIAFSRPLCPFPKVARLKERADPARLESYVCTAP